MGISGIGDSFRCNWEIFRNKKVDLPLCLYVADVIQLQISSNLICFAPKEHIQISGQIVVHCDDLPRFILEVLHI